MKEGFLHIYREEIQREGADKLLSWLESTDFFTAPASTCFHGAYAGGLVEHSMHVYRRLCGLCEWEETRGKGFSPPGPESMAVVALLHDICKANFYAVEMRNRKNDQGLWEKVPFYTVRDQLPYGHGEKSVYILSGFMKLTREEAMAIRWHMGGFDDAVKGGSRCLSDVFERYPLALMLHLADMQATYLDENRKEKE